MAAGGHVLGRVPGAALACGGPVSGLPPPHPLPDGAAEPGLRRPRSGPAQAGFLHLQSGITYTGFDFRCGGMRIFYFGLRHTIFPYAYLAVKFSLIMMLDGDYDDAL